ncbi:MAG TPA: glycosyltransferase family 39 protein, partial [Rhodoferax sp.]|nr:glycosyltransferase family 39 protein [Rhodoferax sp.]
VGSELFGRRVGLALAFLVAVSSWLVTLSRLGMFATSSTPFFSLAALGFLLRGLRRGRLVEFALSGLFLGLGLCFYTSFRLFVPVVSLFLLYAAFYEWRRTHASPPIRFWLGVAIIGVTAVIVVAPLVWFATAHPDIYWTRVEQTFIFAGKSEAQRLPALLENIKRHVLMFNWKGDPNGRHNFPGAPMLDDISAALMVVGLAYSLRRIRDPRYALLPLWLGLTLLGGILSLDFEAPQSLRANGSLGAAYVLAVVPIAVLVRAWRVGDGRYYPNWVWWPVAGVLALAGIANVDTPPAGGSPLGCYIMADAFVADKKNQWLARRAPCVETRQPFGLHVSELVGVGTDVGFSEKRQALQVCDTLDTGNIEVKLGKQVTVIWHIDRHVLQ